MKRYLTIIAVLLVLTVIMATHDLAILVLVLTMGLGLPLFFAGTALAYALMLAPAVGLWHSARVAGIATSAGLVLLLAFGPGLLARTEIERGVAALLADDIKPTAPIAAKSLELAGPEAHYDGEAEPCGLRCRHLLKSGAMRFVRVVVRATAPSNQRRSTFFTLEHGASCAVPGGTEPAPANCVVMKPDNGEPADLVITFWNHAPIKAERASFAALRWGSTREVTAHSSVAGKKHMVLRQTEIGLDKAMMPTLIAVRTAGMTSGGLDFMRTHKQINRKSLGDVLDLLGYGLPADLAQRGQPDGRTPSRRDAWKILINDEMTREMIAVLDLPQSTGFNDEQYRVISNWMSHARNTKDWTPPLIDLLRRILRDVRVTRPTNLDQIFERNPAVTEALLPDVLDLLETRGLSHDYTPYRQAAYKLVVIPPELLAPHAARILALMQRDMDMAELIRPAVGRLGVDPLPYLLPFSGDLAPEAKGRYSHGLQRVRGACFAEPRWSGALIPKLHEALADVPDAGKGKGKGKGTQYRTALLKALANLGDREFVKDELAKSDRDDDRRLLQQIASDRGSNHLCWF